MIKSIFLNILKDPLKGESLNFSKDISQIYQLFRENGYTKDFGSFEKELNEFLNSAEIQELVDKGHYELSGEMLENVSGGAGAFRRALVGGVATLMAALSLSASATTLHDSGYTEPSSFASQSYDYNGYNGNDQGYNDSWHIYDSLSYDQNYNEKGQAYSGYAQIYNDSGHIYDSLSNDQNHNEKEAGSVFNSQASFDSSTSADDGAEESQDDNNNQNAQVNVNNSVEVLENKGGPIPPPLPPPPVYNATNAAKTTKTSAAKHEANAAKDGAQQKSMAEEIAEKAKSGALKKVEKKAENQKKDGSKKDLKDLILEQRAKMKKQSGNASGEKKDKKQGNNNQNAQANVDNSVEIVENKGEPIPPPPPPPPAPVYNASKTTKTFAVKHEVNVAKGGAQKKSMADEIAAKAKPGALKKVEKKAENEKKEEKQDKNFLQNALSEAIKIRRANLHMHDDENEVEEDDDDWD